MSIENDTKKIELIIREPVNKIAEEVAVITNAVGLDEKSTVKAVVSDKIEEVANKVIAETTAQVETIVTEKLGLKMISELSLSEDQKKLAIQIYDATKAALKSFISDTSLNNTVKITKTIGQIIKQLENVKVDGKAPSGEDKKLVAIHLGRILIKEVTPDDKGEAEILMAYDLIAEPTLEAMIDVSKVVNTAVQEMATKCCPSVFNLLKSLLRK
jgi:glutaredoxin 2